MWLIEWHHCQWPWVTLAITFAAWNLSNSKYLVKYSIINYIMFIHTWIRKCTWLVISNVWTNQWHPEVISSHICTYCKCGNTLDSVQDRNVVIETSNRKWYYVLLNSGNSCNLEWPLGSLTYCKPFQMVFCVQLCRDDKISFGIARLLSFCESSGARFTKKS